MLLEQQIIFRGNFRFISIFVTRKDRKVWMFYMAKKLDLNKPVFELVQEYPELVDVFKGF